MIRSMMRMMITSTMPPKQADGEAQRNADHHRDDHHREADEQRDARAVHEAREHVAAHRIGAEQEARVAALQPERRQLGEAAVLFQRIVRAPGHWRKIATKHDDADDDQADDGAAVFAEGAPEGAKRAGRRGGGCESGDVSRHLAMADPRIDEAIEQIDDAG